MAPVLFDHEDYGLLHLRLDMTTCQCSVGRLPGTFHFGPSTLAGSSMLPFGAVSASAGVFPGLAWSAYKVSSPSMRAWAARTQGMLQASGFRKGVGLVHGHCLKHALGVS
jgi:hypothetical protein